MHREAGFALINVVVVLAISAIIAAGAGMTTVQMINGTKRNNDQATAVRQAQNVGFWISQDALKAQVISGEDDSQTGDIELIVITWKDWETGDIYDIRYVWLDSVDSLKRLRRNQVTCDKDGAVTASLSTLVADSINTANVSLQNDVWRLSVEAQCGKNSVIREYEFSLRLAQS